MPTRIIRTRGSIKPAVSPRVAELMKSISQAEDSAARLVATARQQRVELYNLMHSLKLRSHSVDDLIAELVTPKGRNSNVIDPRGFRKAVKKDDEFYDCITVSVTKAKTVLPEKVLKTITTTTVGAAGEEHVEIRRSGSR